MAETNVGAHLEKKKKRGAQPRPNATRNGCWTCRRYHRKCDDGRPYCRRCVDEYQVECEGYGCRRVAFRAISASNSQPKVNLRHPHPQAMMKIFPDSRYTSHRRVRDLHYCGPMDPVSVLPSEQRHLLTVFTAEFAPLKAISPLQDLYSQDIAPLAATHSQVRVAVLALAAAYLAPSPSAFKYYDDAVQALRTLPLNTLQDKQAYLTSVFVMAWFDIMVFDPEKWIVHLKTLCLLINESALNLWNLASGRRIIHSVARLDCADSLSNRATPMLSPAVYSILGNSSYDRDSIDLDVLVDGVCVQLHGIMGLAAQVSFDWTNGSHPNTEKRGQVLHILEKLTNWSNNLPEPLQWVQSADFSQSSDQPMLLRILWLHYRAVLLHVHHILGIMDSKPWGSSVPMANYCLDFIKNLDCQSLFERGRHRGDMSISFVLAVIGVLIDDPENRAWICEFLTRQGRESLWCGYERAACLQAWWNSIGPGKSLILSEPCRNEIPWGWKPEMGIRIKILYQDIATSSIQHDWYVFSACKLVQAGSSKGSGTGSEYMYTSYNRNQAALPG